MPRPSTLVVVLGLTFAVVPLSGQSPPSPESAPAMLSRDRDLADRRAFNSRAEGALLAQMKISQPVVEVYAQDFVTDAALGTIIKRDHYLLGRYVWKDGAPSLETFLPTTRTVNERRPERSARSAPSGVSPDIIKLLVPDWQLLDARKYDMTPVGRDFLGEVKTLVFDVRPRDKAQPGFTGRIWLDEIDHATVRFQGITTAIDVRLTPASSRKSTVRIDSWRVNVAPGVWLPAFAYVEAIDPQDATGRRTHALMRLWGYDRIVPGSHGHLAKIVVDERDAREQFARTRALSPVQSLRRWETEAAENVLAGLVRARMVAEPGPLDAVLNSIVEKVLSANELVFPTPVTCRVLLTSRLEAFSIGYTLYFSRGLIDSLIDEPSVGLIAAHLLGHLKSGHALVDTRWAFADRLTSLSDAELVSALQFTRTPPEEEEADAAAIALLQRSPYAEKLGNAGTFLEVAQSKASQLPNLLTANFGEHVADAAQIVRLHKLFRVAPPVAPGSLDRLAALPLGGRVVVDIWSGKADLLRAESVRLVAPRENAPFGIMPVAPYLAYIKEAATTIAVK